MANVILTGASSGIGLAAAKLFLQRGDTVWGLCRRTQLVEAVGDPNFHPVACDLTDTASVHQAVAEVLLHGGVDVLVNNAGYGSYGPIETVPMAEARRQLEVNLLGVAELTRLILPVMRQQGHGRIINVSSVAGRMTNLFGGWYHISKYGLESLSDALRMETADFGVQVSIVEPGPIRTDWGQIAAQHLAAAVSGTAYEEKGNWAARRLETTYGGKLFQGPEVVARAILRAATAKHPRARYHAGRGSALLIAMHTLLPAHAFDRLISRVMGC